MPFRNGGWLVSVSAGEQATLDHRGEISLRPNVNVAALTSWLQQELIFQDTPLGGVIEEFNRYSPMPIILVDASLGTLRLNAVFHTTNPVSLLSFVSRLDGIKIERSKDEIKIYRGR